jgi:hypothetical protein
MTQIMESTYQSHETINKGGLSTSFFLRGMSKKDRILELNTQRLSLTSLMLNRMRVRKLSNINEGIQSTKDRSILFISESVYINSYNGMNDQEEFKDIQIWKVNKMEKNAILQFKGTKYDFRIMRTVICCFQRTLFKEFSVYSNPTHHYLVLAFAHSRLLLAPLEEGSDRLDKLKIVHNGFVEAF